MQISRRRLPSVDGQMWPLVPYGAYEDVPQAEEALTRTALPPDVDRSGLCKRTLSDVPSEYASTPLLSRDDADHSRIRMETRGTPATGTCLNEVFCETLLPHFCKRTSYSLLFAPIHCKQLDGRDDKPSHFANRASHVATRMEKITTSTTSSDNRLKEEISLESGTSRNYNGPGVRPSRGQRCSSKQPTLSTLQRSLLASNYNRHEVDTFGITRYQLQRHDLETTFC